MLVKKNNRYYIERKDIDFIGESNLPKFVEDSIKLNKYCSNVYEFLEIDELAAEFFLYNAFIVKYNELENIDLYQFFSNIDCDDQEHEQEMKYYRKTVINYLKNKETYDEEIAKLPSGHIRVKLNYIPAVSHTESIGKRIPLPSRVDLDNVIIEKCEQNLDERIKSMEKAKSYLVRGNSKK